MKNLFLSLFLLFFITNQLIAQTQTVRGVIQDQDSQMPLIGATIQLINTDNPKGTTTDIDGKFELLDIPTGRQSFAVQYLGYEPQLIDELVITPSKEVVLTINLKESVAQLNEVVVTASSENHEALNEMSMISARSMTIEELNRQPANFYDPARMALGFSGVTSAGDDESNEIVVRGNSPAGILWRIEGVEVSNPNHFSEAGTAGGGISMLSTNAMGTSDFFAGAFPAEFGNALSGVFDIKLRNGNSNTTEAAAQIGLLGLNAAVEGPFKKGYDGSYLVNYRYSTLGIIERLGIVESGNGNPNFQDLSFKVRLPTKKMGTFSLFGLGGDFISEDDYTFAREERRDIFKGQTGILGASNLLNLSNRTYLKTVFVANFAGRFYDEGRISPQMADGIDKDYTEFFEDQSSRLSVLLNHKFNSKHVVRAGAVYSWLNYDLNLEERIFDWVENSDGSFSRIYTDDWDTLLDSEGNSYSFQSYVQWKYNISSNLTLNTGLHLLYFGLNENTSIEPRVGLKWQVTPKQSFALGIGRHSKIESLSTYFVQRTNAQDETFLPNRNLPLQKATHYILSYNVNLAKKLNLTIESYYQNIDNLPISSAPNSNVALLNQYYFDVFFDIPSLEGTGKGRNYGVDVSLEKGFSNDTYFVLNGSLFKSEYQTNTNEWYQTRYSSNYNIVAIGGKEFHFGKKAKRTLGLNTRILLNGALRYTPIDEAASLEAQQTIFQQTPFTEHLPTYWRADIGINYSWYKKRVVHALSLNVQNVTNR
ncbi:MAG: TonB-dependent receptor, partial [Bacteroidota bacterium]